jgi:hypothetical protein
MISRGAYTTTERGGGKLPGTDMVMSDKIETLPAPDRKPKVS